MKRPNNKFEKMLKEQQHFFKIDILEQFCESVHQTLVVPGDDGPWREQVREKRLRFKRIEFSKTFGVLHLHYVDEDDPDQLYRLSLELKKA